MILDQLINDSYLQWLPIEDYLLQDHEVHLWLFELPPMIGPARFEKLHELKIKRRQLLIKVLSNYFEKPINDNDFDLMASGKPYLKEHTLQFNTTHCKNLLLIAIHKNLPLGIDIECMSQRSIEHFSQRFWGQSWYLKNLHPLANYLKPLSFFQAWTGTEAWVKALSQTIFNHQDFPITGFPVQKAQRHDNWQFKYFMPYPSVMASICCHQLIKQVFINKISIEDLK